MPAQKGRVACFAPRHGLRGCNTPHANVRRVTPLDGRRAAFDQKIVALPYVESNPPLSQMKRARIFGKNDVDIGWAPGADEVKLRFSGLLTAVCAGDDAAGTFSVSRKVLDAILYSADDTEKASCRACFP